MLNQTDFYPFGMISRSTTASGGDYRFTFNGQEKDDEVYGSTGTSLTAEFWQYDCRTGRRWNLDPVDQVNISNYATFGGNPLVYVDPKGNSKDWFKNQQTGEVQWHDVSGKIGEEVSLIGSTDTWTNLGVNANTDPVTDAVGSHIMNQGGWDAFMKYYKNPKLGEGFFFEAASKHTGNATGMMAGLLRNYPASQDGLSLSELTHGWVNAAGWTKERNALEHNMGMFLMSSRHGPIDANIIGTANEVRGLFFNDRQNGNMLRAVFGQPTENGGATAFEWADLGNNRDGIGKFLDFRDSDYSTALRCSSFLQWEKKTTEAFKGLNHK